MTLRTPLREHLDSTTDEARISRMWSNIRTERERTNRAPFAIAAGLAAAAVVAIGLHALLRPPETTGSLRLTDGSSFGRLDSGAGARNVALTDGSSIELAPESELLVVQNDEARFSTLLASGRARFAVQPGGRRRWVIEGGYATVEVIGTVFTVDRSEAGVRVAVERGIVLVRGDRVPERVRRLTAGQDIFVAATAADETQAGPAEPEEDRVDESPMNEPPVNEPPVNDSPAEVAPAPAAVEAGSSASDAPRRGTDAVGRALARADDARRRGDLEEATAQLRVAMGHADDPRAALAAFTLGRIEMDELRRADRARAAFERALQLGLPSSLIAQARRRIEELDNQAP